MVSLVKIFTIWNAQYQRFEFLTQLFRNHFSFLRPKLIQTPLSISSVTKSTRKVPSQIRFSSFLSTKQKPKVVHIAKICLNLIFWKSFDKIPRKKITYFTLNMSLNMKQNRDNTSIKETHSNFFFVSAPQA